MINCKEVSEDASNYIDGNLPLMKRLSIKLHIFICVRCRQYIEQLSSTATAVAAVKPKEKTSSDAQAIAQELLEKCKKTKSEH